MAALCLLGHNAQVISLKISHSSVGEANAEIKKGRYPCLSLNLAAVNGCSYLNVFNRRDPSDTFKASLPKRKLNTGTRVQMISGHFLGDGCFVNEISNCLTITYLYSRIFLMDVIYNL